MNIPEDQSKALTDLASSGDASAKSWASELGIGPKPASSGNENKGQNGAANDAKSESGTKPDGAAVRDESPEGQAKLDGEAKDGVDAHRDGAGDGGKKPSIYAEVRRLKQERRDMRTQRDESRKREETLNARLADLEARLKTLPDGSKSPSTEEDILTKLLTNPEAVFQEREKKLGTAIRQAVNEAVAQARAFEQQRAEKSSAIKILESIPNFDLEENEDEVFQLMEEEYGLDEEDVEHLLATRSEKTARWIKKAWEKKHSLALPEKERAAKAAARSSVSSGGGQTHSKTSFGDLNARAKGARSAEELEKLWEEAGRLS